MNKTLQIRLIIHKFYLKAQQVHLRIIVLFMDCLDSQEKPQNL